MEEKSLHILIKIFGANEFRLRNVSDEIIEGICTITRVVAKDNIGVRSQIGKLLNNCDGQIITTANGRRARFTVVQSSLKSKPAIYQFQFQ